MRKGSWAKLAEENKGTRQNSQNSFKESFDKKEKEAQKLIDLSTQYVQQSQTNDKFQCLKCRESKIPHNEHPIFWDIGASEAFVCCGKAIEEINNRSYLGALENYDE